MDSWVNEFLDKMQIDGVQGGKNDGMTEGLFDKIQFIILGNKCD